MKKRILGLVLMVSVALGCAAIRYGGDLDACAFQYRGNIQAIHACQCQVSQANGRDCSWLDGGTGGWLPEAGPVDGGAQ